MVIIFAALFVVTQQCVNYFVTGDNLWYISQFLSMAETATALYFLTIFIPYNRLLIKTVSGVWCAVSVTDCLVYPLWFISSPVANYVHEVQFLAGVVVFFYVSIKSYKIESDPVAPGYIYQVRAVPATFQDAVLSVFYLKPFGGTGIICAGGWYHYRKGVLKCDPVNVIPLNKYVILRTRKELLTDKELLNHSVKEKWTWTQNCVTRLHPFSLTGYLSVN